MLDVALHGAAVLHYELDMTFVFNRWETLFMPPLQSCIRRPVQPSSSPAKPLRREEIPVQELLQNLLSHVAPAQTWGILAVALHTETVTHTHSLSASDCECDLGSRFSCQYTHDKLDTKWKTHPILKCSTLGSECIKCLWSHSEIRF